MNYIDVDIATHIVQCLVRSLSQEPTNSIGYAFSVSGKVRSPYISGVPLEYHGEGAGYLKVRLWDDHPPTCPCLRTTFALGSNGDEV